MASAWDSTPATAPSAWDATPDPTAGMSTFDLLSAGAGKAMTDMARGAGQLVPVYRNGQWGTLVTRDDVAQARARDAALMGTTSGKVGNFVGNVAMAAPAALIPGANTIAGSAAIGAGAGLLQPSTSTGETLRNVGVGGAAGAAVPAAITALKAAKSLVEPLYQSGRDQIIGRTISEAAAQDPQVLAASLRSAQSKVPGVQYTAAEVADNPSLAALQRTAVQTNPTVMNEAVARQTANNQALGTALTDAAGSDGQRAFLDANRQAAAQDLYEKAFSVPVEMENLSAAQRGEITKLTNMPAVQDALKQARTNASNFGMSLDNPQGNIMGLHQAKLAMDDQIGKLMGGSAAQVNKARAITAARDRLVTFMESMSPDYADARQTYAAMSKPINAMDVVQQIANKSTNPMNGAIYPQQFARALSDDTARSVTGMSGATLDNTLPQTTIDSLGAIKDALARQQFAQNAGRTVGSDTVQKLAYSNLMNQTGVPSLVRNFPVAGVVGNLLERGGQMVYADANKKLSEQLARALLNPQDAAGLVQSSMVSPQMQAIVEALRRAGTVGAASAPALVQSSQ